MFSLNLTGEVSFVIFHFKLEEVSVKSSSSFFSSYFKVSVISIMLSILSKFPLFHYSFHFLKLSGKVFLHCFLLLHFLLQRMEVLCFYFYYLHDCQLSNYQWYYQWYLYFHNYQWYLYFHTLLAFVAPLNKSFGFSF